jgi:hypothetical protein
VGHPRPPKFALVRWAVVLRKFCVVLMGRTLASFVKIDGSDAAQILFRIDGSDLRKFCVKSMGQTRASRCVRWRSALRRAERVRYIAQPKISSPKINFELMSDPETPLPDLSPQLSNVQNSLYSAIENSKKQQWTITNYVILVYAAIFGLSQALKPLGIIERRMFGALVAVAGVYAIGLLVQIQWDLRRYRKQLEAFHTQTISKEDRERYLRPRKYRGGWFLGALLGVVLIGAGLVIYSLRRS